LVLLGAFARAGIFRLTAPGPLTPSLWVIILLVFLYFFLIISYFPLIGDRAATSTKILAEAVGVVAVGVLFLPSFSLMLRTVEEFPPAVPHCRTKKSARHRTASPSYGGTLHLVCRRYDCKVSRPVLFHERGKALVFKELRPDSGSSSSYHRSFIIWRHRASRFAGGSQDSEPMRISSLPSIHVGTAMTARHCVAVRWWWRREAHCSRWSSGYQIVYPSPCPARSCFRSFNRDFRHLRPLTRFLHDPDLILTVTYPSPQACVRPLPFLLLALHLLLLTGVRKTAVVRY
jgi:hypothetical protein